MVPVEKRVKEMQSMIAGDQLDVAFMTLNEYDRTKDNYISLSNEEILLGVRRAPSASLPLPRLAIPGQFWI